MHVSHVHRDICKTYRVLHCEKSIAIHRLMIHLVASLLTIQRVYGKVRIAARTLTTVEADRRDVDALTVYTVVVSSVLAG